MAGGICAINTFSIGKPHSIENYEMANFQHAWLPININYTAIQT